jgi:hypothetical protein
MSEKLSKNYEMYLINSQVSVKIFDNFIYLIRSRDFSCAMPHPVYTAAISVSFIYFFFKLLFEMMFSTFLLINIQ